MNLKDFLWKKRFKPEEFYNQVLNGQTPIEYKDVGDYLHNIFLFYDYSDDFVKETLKLLDELKNNNFNFVNMEYKVLFYFAKCNNNYDYQRLFDYYRKTFINKDYQELYNTWEDFNKYLLKESYGDDIIKLMSLSLLIMTYSASLITLKDIYKYREYSDKTFAMNVLKALTIKFLINNNKDLEELANTVKDNILDNSFIDNCSLKGIDTTSQSFQSIDYIATLIYNHEFNKNKKKIIE